MQGDFLKKSHFLLQIWDENWYFGRSHTVETRHAHITVEFELFPSNEIAEIAIVYSYRHLSKEKEKGFFEKKEVGMEREKGLEIIVIIG